MKLSKRLAILQPEVPHYREEFFDLLKQQCECADVFVYNSLKDTQKNGFNVKGKDLIYIPNKQLKGFLLYNPFSLLGKKYDTLVLMLHFAHLTTWFNVKGKDLIYIPNKQLKGFLLYNPFSLLGKKYDTLVLMLHFAHLTTWLLLLTKFIHRKKIILWGQGISVKRYLAEERKPDWKLKTQMALADGVWLYMEKELKQWKGIFPNKKLVALNNTLTGVASMCRYESSLTKGDLKEKYGITQEVVLIFCARCARFESNYRRTDLLVDVIKRLDTERFGFVIIGEGKNKPDFSEFTHVYDFGAVYDTAIKRELFTLSDIYFQPGWVGLSIVEAMAYGKPVFTFHRSEETKQCVEYSYIKSGVNGMIFESVDECVDYITHTGVEVITDMGVNARLFVKEHLSVEQMANNALSILR